MPKGDFICGRSFTYTKFPPYWPNTGKFDKIAFTISTDHYIVGIVAGSPIQWNMNVYVSVKLTDIAGNSIATASITHAFKTSLVYVFFDRPYRITAGQQYIAATRVYIPPSSYPPLITYVKTVTSTQCGPSGHMMTVTFSNVPPAEMDDSNGSTVEKGRATKLVFKPL